MEALAVGPMAKDLNTRKAKIVAIITHNDRGGAQEALTRLCSGLYDRGHDVTLWYLYKQGDFVDAGLPSQFVLAKENLTLIDYGLIGFRLARMLTQTRPTVTISFLPLANTLAQTLAWAKSIPIRVASQRNPVQTYSRAMQLLDWYVGTCGSYTHNVVNSSDVRQSISGYPWPYRYRTSVIHNGIEPISFGDGCRKDARSHFKIEPSDVALISIGRLAKQKNQALLIQILGAIPNVKLLLAGSGPEMGRLLLEAERMGVAERVAFLGALGQSETKRLLNAADIFALPSLYEGQSNALLEAMSAGKAIVTSDIPSHRETLTSRGCHAGLLVPITDPDGWIRTLKDLSASRDKRIKLGQRAKKRAKDFSLDQMCSAFEALITGYG